MTSKTFRFDQALRFGLARAGLTQSDLARRVGVSRQAVSQWMKPNSNASIERVTQVALILDMPLNKFLELGKKQKW
ncbi:MAG: helix-turn-helix domain-containing protein [bacterium]